MIDVYLDAGGNHFDIANVYAGGRAEEIVGEALRESETELSSPRKCDGRWGAGRMTPVSPAIISSMRSEASLRRLGTEVIDVLYLHGWDPWTPLTETLAAFARSRERRKGPLYRRVELQGVADDEGAVDSATATAGRVSSPRNINTASSSATSRRNSSTSVFPKASALFPGARSAVVS